MNKPKPKEETFPRCPSPHLMSPHFLLAASVRDCSHALPPIPIYNLCVCVHVCTRAREYIFLISDTSKNYWRQEPLFYIS